MEGTDSSALGNLENMRANNLSAITAAEKALKEKENEIEKLDRNTIHLRKLLSLQI